MNKADNNMEYKEISLTDFELKLDSDHNTFEGYASTFGNEDRVGDIVVRGAFVESIKKRKPKMLWQHDMGKPIGVYDEVYEDNAGLYVKGRLADTALGNEAAELARMGAIDAMSIGFSVKDYEYDKDKRRTIKQLDLYEISLVTFPANERALITSAKSELPKTEREFERFLRDAGYSRKQAAAITLAGFKTAEGSQRDAGLEALQNTFNSILERINHE